MPNCAEQDRFNHAHTHTRVKVECTISILKARCVFQCYNLAVKKYMTSHIYTNKLTLEHLKHRNHIFAFRFACLKRGLTFKNPNKCCKIILSCMVLHNFCTLNRDHIELGPEAKQNTEADDAIVSEIPNAVYNAGKMYRNYIAHSFFRNH